MIDVSHCKVSPHATGAVGGNPAMSRTKGDSIPSTPGRGCAWYAAQSFVTKCTPCETLRMDYKLIAQTVSKGLLFFLKHKSRNN